jgi:hypothetical protein
MNHQLNECLSLIHKSNLTDKEKNKLVDSVVEGYLKKTQYMEPKNKLINITKNTLLMLIFNTGRIWDWIMRLRE